MGTTTLRNVSIGVPKSRTVTAGEGLTGGGDLSADRTVDVAANADGSVVVNADDIQVGVLATDAQHGGRGGGATHALAVAAGAAGFISGADKSKLDGVAVGADVDTSLVYDPAGVAPSGANVFTTFTALHAAFLLTPGLVVIWFPGPATIEAGSYDFGFRSRWIGARPLSGDPHIISLAPGVTLDGFNYIEALELRQTGVGPSISMVGGQQLVVYQVARLSSSNGPLIETNSVGPAAAIVCAFDGIISDAGGSAVINVASGPCAVLTILFSFINVDTVTGPGVLIQITDAQSNMDGAPFPATQVGFTGFLLALYFSEARLVNYVPGAPASWSGDPPTVNLALDRLAAAVAGLLAGPVP